MTLSRSIKHFILRRIYPQPRQNEILFLIDVQNLSISFESLHQDPLSYSLIDALDGVIDKITKVGRIEISIAFGSQLSLPLLDMLNARKIPLIVCPEVVIDKGEPKSGKKDTVDPRLIELGTTLIEKIPTLTHLCLASGDKDFIPFLRWAKQQGLKIILAPATAESLAEVLIGLACENPERPGEKAIFFLSPPKSEINPPN